MTLGDEGKTPGDFDHEESGPRRIDFQACCKGDTGEGSWVWTKSAQSRSSKLLRDSL